MSQSCENKNNELKITDNHNGSELQQWETLGRLLFQHNDDLLLDTATVQI